VEQLVEQPNAPVQQQALEQPVRHWDRDDR